jgi:hypothetical protein
MVSFPSLDWRAIVKKNANGLTGYVKLDMSGIPIGETTLFQQSGANVV